MSRSCLRVFVLSMACIFMLAGAAQAQHFGRGGGGGAPRQGGGGGGPRIGGGGGPHFGGGGGGAHIGGGGRPSFAAPAVRSFGGGAPRFNAPAMQARPVFRGGGMPAMSARSFPGRSFSGRTFSGRTFSGRSLARPSFSRGVAQRGFARPGLRGSRTFASSRALRGGRFVPNRRFAHGGRAGGRAGLRAMSARSGLGANVGRRGLAGRSIASGRRAGRSVAGRGLGPRGVTAANPGSRFVGARPAQRLVAGQPFRRNDWHRHWRGHRALYAGWVGPLFWPYAYEDVFYDSVWGNGFYGPDDVDDDPFWSYGYADIYDGLFSPYSYGELAEWTRPSSQSASRRASPRTRTAVRGGSDAAAVAPAPTRWQQMCGEDSREIVGMPIDRIRDIVQPTDAQRALLDQLGEASIKAAQTVRDACPSDYSLTPGGRMAAMEQRLRGLRQAVEIMRSPLDAFYGSLGDEQKARLNAAGQNEDGRPARGFAQDCTSAAVATEWPAEQIERKLRPNQTQRAALDRLRETAQKAADGLRSSCPAGTPATPPARLAAMAARLDAMIDAVASVRMAANEFYGTLDDEQKAQFNTIGQARARQR
jgi:hypothetical protein